jgi:hypothetical protein
MHELCTTFRMSQLVFLLYVQGYYDYKAANSQLGGCTFEECHTIATNCYYCNYCCWEVLLQ